jgi:predicted nucleic acid-binding protein
MRVVLDPSAAVRLVMRMPDDHPVYDLLYAVTARRDGCTVLTRDCRLTDLLRLMEIPILAS